MKYELLKDVYFDDNLECWSTDEEIEREENSQNFDLNMNPVNEDPMLPSVDIPASLTRKLREPRKDCLIVKLLGKSI